MSRNAWIEICTNGKMQVRNKGRDGRRQEGGKRLFSPRWPWVRSLEEVWIPQRGHGTGRRCYVSAWPGSLQKHIWSKHGCFQQHKRRRAVRVCLWGILILIWLEIMMCTFLDFWNAVAFCCGNKVCSSFWGRWIFLSLTSKLWIWLNEFLKPASSLSIHRRSRLWSRLWGEARKACQRPPPSAGWGVTLRCFSHLPNWHGSPHISLGKMILIFLVL